MITLCGFAVSNYYNKVKLALLEKQVPFTEKKVSPGQDAALLDASPLGKIPYIETEQGPVSESQVILEYLETCFPAHRLLPQDPWAAAKERELITHLELHIELVARELYGEVFFGAPRVPDAIRERTEKLLRRNLKAWAKLAKFSPYVAGGTFSMADCAAYVHLPLVAGATKAAFGSDLVADAGVDWKGYLKLVGERASAQRVGADRKAALDERAKQS